MGRSSVASPRSGAAAADPRFGPAVPCVSVDTRAYFARERTDVRPDNAMGIGVFARVSAA
jgi:hypothetical protein